MKKTLLILVSAACILLSFVSCKNNFADVDKIVVTPETRSYAEQQFAAANDAFRNLVESKCRSVSQDQIDPEDYSTWSPADRLEAAAWLGILNDDAEETIKIAKEYGIYKELMDIVKEYDLENCVNIRNAAARNAARSVTKEQIKNLSKTGDIFLSHSYDSSQAGSSVALLNTLTRGYFKHAGIIDKRRISASDYCILSASNDNDHFNKANSSLTNLGAVGYESTKKWSDSGIAVGVVRVNNTTAAQCNAALDAGKNWLGIKYGLTSARDSNSNFYCSKVVYRCWLSQGRDLEYNTWYFLRGAFVTPQDLYDDSDTTFVFGDKPN